MATIEMQIETPRWRKAWPRLAVEAKALLRAAAAHPRLTQKWGAVVVVFADDAKLQALNSQFRGKDRPTNVLSFPDGELEPGGGIALAFETISAEAKAQGKPFVYHSKHMILHGFLHLLGFDHEKPSEARLMEGLEIAILSDMGIPNPYLIETNRRA
jgi:probable rRNA maturation factor